MSTATNGPPDGQQGQQGQTERAGSTCGICARDDVTAIDAALSAHRISKRAIANKYGVSTTSLRRHAYHTNAPRVASFPFSDLASRLVMYDAFVFRALERAEKAGDNELVLKAAKEGRLDVESLAKIATLQAMEERLQALETRLAETQRQRPLTVVSMPPNDTDTDTDNEREPEYEQTMDGR